jgi:hypothetical protein
LWVKKFGEFFECGKFDEISVAGKFFIKKTAFPNCKKGAKILNENNSILPNFKCKKCNTKFRYCKNKKILQIKT